MVILFSIILICILLAIGVSVPLAFGAVLILLAYTGGYDVSGFFFAFSLTGKETCLP